MFGVPLECLSPALVSLPPMSIPGPQQPGFSCAYSSDLPLGHIQHAVYGATLENGPKAAASA